MNAGPLADRPVTPSMCFSSTTTVRPTVSNSCRAVWRWSSVAWLPRHNPVMPAPTWHGVLGIARTTGTPFSRRASIKLVGTDAATETTSAAGVTSGRICSSRSPTFCGLTATTTTSAPRTAARLSVSTAMGSRPERVAARSAWRTVARTPAGARPALSSPWSRMVPILPSPNTATRWFFMWFSSQVLLECGRRVGLRVAVFHDHRRVQGDAPSLRRGARRGAGPRDHHGARRDLERSVAVAPVHRIPYQVVHGRGTREHRAGSEHGALPHDRALVDAASTAHEHVVFDDHRQCSHGLEHPADLGGRGQVHAL